MTSVIKPKRTSTSGNNPTTANLAEGEIAINLADKKLFVRDTANNILTIAEPVIPAVEDATDINMTGSLDILTDYTTEGTPLTASTNVNNMPGNQQNGPVTAYFLKEAANSSRRMRMLLGTSNAGTPNYTISLDSRFQNSEKKFRIQANSDDDLGSGNMLSEMIYNTTTGIKTHRIRGRIDMSDVDAVSQPNALRMEVNANGQNYANFMTGTLHHGAVGVNGATQSMNFQAKNDADGETGVGQIQAEYKTDGNNRMSIRAYKPDYSETASLSVDFNNAGATVPYKHYNVNLATTLDPWTAQPGMTVFDTSDNKLKTYDGTTWQAHW